MLCDWRFGGHLVCSFNCAGRGHRAAPIFFFPTSRNLSGFRCGGNLGRARRTRPRVARRKRSLDFAHVELRRNFHFAIPGGRPDQGSGSLPETKLLPRATWLPFIIPGTRAHAGILIAIAAAALVWMLLQKMPLGYELIVTGFNASAARYAGIDVGRRILLSAFFAGGLGGLAGMVDVLGAQHRLMDGISGGVGFVGIVVALLARLNPVAVIPTAFLYGGMSVGADAMQRRASIPSSITFILQSLAVLLVLAIDALRYYKINFAAVLNRRPPITPAAVNATSA